MWGGSSNRKNVHWVSWKTVCLPKEKGGLGIKDIAFFNKSMLLKRKWRFITKSNSIWKGVIDHRYSYSCLALAVTSYDGAGGFVEFKDPFKNSDFLLETLLDQGIMKWLGIEVKLNASSHVSFSCFGGSLRKEIGNMVEGNVMEDIVWTTYVRLIWICRNNLMQEFSNRGYH
ncbi:hypothetical protein KIW84_074811 [Lathyrus oleraceus]|uniref:RNA-directed DNA polymerase, eukaryota, reverse transcriptase zinc-binding domain protein n=1 Tax=Pisum sativum TaxID=3888 RepID=A0A9D4VV40_PEA|nr:hypothetical protein KIW84_074811 [Pisum sativum]